MTAANEALGAASRLTAQGPPPDDAAEPGRPNRTTGDAVALAALVLIVLVCVGFRFVYENWLAGSDILDFFLPNYGYVGDRLRSFEVPAWNPYFSSGTPIAGDAGGGWMYLPVMLAFTLLDAGNAIKAMVLLQVLIGGGATYALGRRLGLFPMAALFAATAFAIGPALYGATGQSTVIGQISAFVPLGLLGAECAMGAHRWSAGLAWSGLAGVALVQLFAAWPQGCLYGAMLIAGWFAYRGLLAPPDPPGRRMLQVQRMLIWGSATLVLAAAFGAAAILPRADFSAQSTIPDGDYSAVVGGEYVAAPFSWIQTLGIFLQTSVYWRIVEHNSAILVLALLPIVLGCARYGVPFFALAAGVFLDLATTDSLTRPILGVLPMFERVHGHRPTATVYIAFLPLAMLAGAGVQTLLERRRVRGTWLRTLLPPAIILVAMLAVRRAGDPVAWPQVASAITAGVLIVAAGSPLPAAWRQARAWLPRTAAAGLLLVVLLYPTAADFVYTVRHPDGLAELVGLLSPALDAMQLPADQPELSSKIGKDESIEKAVQTVLARGDPGSAAQFLQDARSNQPPFRYAAYFGTGSSTTYVPSTAFRLEPRMVASLAGARSARLGLEQIAGYNPLHLKHYAEYVEAMNGARQDYHWLDVYTAAVSGSQLLDMLNVRFVLVPTGLPHSPRFAQPGREVYRDDLVVVYENPGAFARAWLVHDVRPDDGHGLALLADGSVDGHLVAFVDGPLPPVGSSPLAPPTGSRTPEERVSITSVRPEVVTVHLTSATDGLLVVSQAYANGWNGYVDGQRIPVVRTDQALQGVPVPAGDHVVVLEYEPAGLTVGLWVTGGSVVLLLGVWSSALAGWLRGSARRRAALRQPAAGPG